MGKGFGVSIGGFFTGLASVAAPLGATISMESGGGCFGIKFKLLIILPTKNRPCKKSAIVKKIQRNLTHFASN